MQWKRYKTLKRDDKHKEIYYIIGLDIGNDSSSIAFFNLSVNAPEIIDLSGGYGRPSIPTVMQYISETKEWVFGEYALLNRGVGSEVTLTDLVERLGHHEYVDIDHKPVSVVSLLGLFIKELIGNVKSINPKAEIVGIVAAIPGYFSEQARDELQRAFKTAGYEKELIALVTDRECVFAHYYMTRKPQEERALLLDYGSREVRGGLYHTLPQGNTVAVKSMSSLFEESIGTAKINEDVGKLFNEFYAKNTKTLPSAWNSQVREQISAFAYQHKDILFQKNIRLRPVKLYFNFAYPPFQQTVAQEHSEKLTQPYQKRFNRFIHDVLEKNLYEDVEITPNEVNNVLCVGGGFEMLWAREAVEKMFRRAQIQFYKNAKVVTAEGAAVVAALFLEAAESYAVAIEDKHQLRVDVGLAARGDLFLPLVERNAFWWQKHSPKKFLINTPCGGDEVISLDLAVRDANGDVKTLTAVKLDGLPPRPKGSTRLNAKLNFTTNTELNVTFADDGFGELFPKSKFETTVAVTLP